MRNATRDTIDGPVRNWPMPAIAAVAVLLGRWSIEGGQWLRNAGIALVVVGSRSISSPSAPTAGRMPVRTRELPPGSPGHRVMTGKTRLRFLGDWIDAWRWMISPGDVCLFTGIAIILTARLLQHV